ncbi:MAG: NYN domain-containing protein [Nitrospira sp.]|nr:MAG: NYN domain-containing protein [Nitrospira sp.]
MSNHLIIDGYNLLGARGQIAPHSGANLEAAREGLIRELARYHQQKAHAITLVFDGWQQGSGVERHEHRSGVRVMYTKRGERADQVIQRLAGRDGRDCSVVSSDREVMEAARASGAFVVSSAEFARKLQAPTASVRPGEKDERDLPPRRPDKKGNPRKLPKSVRRRQARLKRF